MKEIPKKKFYATVLKTESIAQGVKKITFKIHEPFPFLAWQYVWVEIPDMKMPDSRGSRRAFSILNTINSDNTIEIVARISDSGYKQSLFALDVNDKAIIHGPFGWSFIVDEKHQPENIIMIAGGVGVVAFLPMLWTIRDQGYKSKCHLVYLNKDENTTPFLPELKDLKDKTNFFDFKNKYEYFSWSDVNDVASQMKGEIEWWVAGTQGMVDHVYKELEAGGVSRLDMFFENFYPTDKISITRETVEKHLSSDNVFLKAIENSTNHTVLTDTNGTILFANKAAETTTGYSLGEILGNTPRLWGGMMSHEFYVDFWQKKKSGDVYVGEITNRRKNGDIYHAIAHIAPILNQNKEIIGYVGTEEDVTDRVNLEKRVTTSKEFLDTIVQNLPSMVFVKDANDLKFTLFNKAGEELLGISADQLIGKSDYDFFPKEQANFFAGKDREVLNNKILIDIEEEEINTKNKGKRILHTKKIPIFNQSGVVNFLLGISEDITEKKKYEIEILSEKAKSEAVITGLIDGVAIADTEGKLVYFNDIGERMLGLGADQSAAEKWADRFGLYDPATNEIYPSENLPLARAVRGETVKDIILFVRNQYKPDGLYLSVSATPIIVGGKNEGAVAIFRDITKEREIDKEKSEFVSLASHQLKTPVGAISWNLEMLLAGDYGQVSDKQKGIIQESYAMNRRMNELINALLNVSRLETGVFIIEPKPTDFVKLCEEVLVEMENRLEKKGHKLTKNFDKNIPQIPADEKLLRIIFQNFISNAIKYTQNKGKIILSLKVDNGTVVFSVANNGEPIPEGDQSRIFSKMYRASNAQEQDPDGNGLGLYVVKQIVENGKGKIWFTSKKGEDTVFACSFPLSGMIAKSGTKQLS